VARLPSFPTLQVEYPAVGTVTGGGERSRDMLAYEGMLRKLLSFPHRPAVLLLQTLPLEAQPDGCVRTVGRALMPVRQTDRRTDRPTDRCHRPRRRPTGAWGQTDRQTDAA
jgi:hypothetical protein